jgi:hypothetical protein
MPNYFDEKRASLEYFLSWQQQHFDEKGALVECWVEQGSYWLSKQLKL